VNRVTEMFRGLRAILGRGTSLVTLRGMVAVIGILLVGSVLSLIPYLGSSAELVRLRNALLLDAAPLDASWAGSGFPHDFRMDSAPFPQSFVAFVQTHSGQAIHGDWERSVSLASALIPDRGQRRAGAIQSSMTQTLERIMARGDGYCGDYADVFAGLMSVAGIQSRRWSFSFDQFGGHGHIFNEVWDAPSSSWRMLDLQHNFFPANPEGIPLSALQFRSAILSGDRVSLLPIDQAAAFGFKTNEDAIGYYHRGLQGWYMTWGNNLFEQDRVWAANLLAPLHRALEQLAVIFSGKSPGIRLMVDEHNHDAADRLLALRHRLLLISLLILLFGAAVSALVVRALIRKRL